MVWDRLGKGLLLSFVWGEAFLLFFRLEKNVKHTDYESWLFTEKRVKPGESQGERREKALANPLSNFLVFLFVLVTWEHQPRQQLITAKNPLLFSTYFLSIWD